MDNIISFHCDNVSIKSTQATLISKEERKRVDKLTWRNVTFFLCYHFKVEVKCILIAPFIVHCIYQRAPIAFYHVVQFLLSFCAHMEKFKEIVKGKLLAKIQTCQNGFFASRDDDNEHILLFFDELRNCIFTILLWKHPVHRGLDGGTKAQLKSTGIPHLGLGRTRQSTTEGRRSLTKTVEIPPLYLERTKFFVCFWQLVLNIELIPLILSQTVFNFEKIIIIPISAVSCRPAEFISICIKVLGSTHTHTHTRKGTQSRIEYVWSSIITLFNRVYFSFSQLFESNLSWWWATKQFHNFLI